MDDLLAREPMGLLGALALTLAPLIQMLDVLSGERDHSWSAMDQFPGEARHQQRRGYPFLNVREGGRVPQAKENGWVVTR